MRWQWIVVASIVIVGMAAVGIFVVPRYGSQPETPRPPTSVTRDSDEPESRLDQQPCRGERISSGNDLTAVVNEAPENTTFCISGFHRLSEEIVPKDGQQFIGVGRPLLNGSRLLTSFDREGAYWVADQQTQDYTSANPKILDEPCTEGYEGCHFPEDVYVDDEFLNQVLSLDELNPGEYFFDYESDRIYLADDPTGRKVEASVVRRAFSNYAQANDVVIRGLVIEKFSSYAGQDSTVGSFHGSNWVVEGNEIRLNHGSGISVGETAHLAIRDNYIHHNGCAGILGPRAEDLLIEDNEISFNNALHYRSYSWSCGGGKVLSADGLTFRGNYSHHNNGFGFWTDALNMNVLYESNVFSDNAMGGVMHEINDGSLGPTSIRHNIFRRNGFGHPNRVMMGAAIIISASNHVEIVDNVLEGNAHGITLNYTLRGDFADRDLTVHDIAVHGNIIRLTSGGNHFSGVARVGFYTSTVGLPSPDGISFSDNTYYLGDPAEGPHFSVPDPNRPFLLSTLDAWRDAGFDTSSQFLPLSEFPTDAAA